MLLLMKTTPLCHYMSGPVFSYKLRHIVGFWLVEMAISTNQKPTIYRNLYENTGPVLCIFLLTVLPGCASTYVVQPLPPFVFLLKGWQGSCLCENVFKNVQSGTLKSPDSAKWGSVFTVWVFGVLSLYKDKRDALVPVATR